MGNISSSGGGGGRRRRNRRHSHTLPPQQPPPPPASIPPPQPPPSTEIAANRFVFAAATPFPNPNPNQAYQYPGYYSPQPGAMPVPLPAAYQHPYHHHLHYPTPQPLPYHHHHPWNTAGRYPYGGGPMIQPPPPYVEHQKAVTIRNDVNLKKETLRLDSDPDCPGRFLVSFTFDATVSGRITLIFFAKETEECNLIATKEDTLPPITMDFEKGLGQKFKQPSGSGIDFSVFEDAELFTAADVDIYPLAVKAEAVPPGDNEEERLGSKNAQITQAVYEKDKGEVKIRVVKQILWVNGLRYELQEIYGIGNTVDGDESSADDANDPGKECVICLSEPRDTTVLPCRHMCMCSGCAKVLRFQTNRCPICRQPVERLLEIKVHGNGWSGNNTRQGEGEAATTEQEEEPKNMA